MVGLQLFDKNDWQDIRCKILIITALDYKHIKLQHTSFSPKWSVMKAVTGCYTPGCCWAGDWDTTGWADGCDNWYSRFLSFSWSFRYSEGFRSCHTHSTY